MLIAVDYEYLSTVAFDMLVFGEQPSGQSDPPFRILISRFPLKILMVIWQQNRDSDPFKTAVSWFFTYVLLLICSAHRSDFLLYRKSCMLTGKMSDIRRNRLFSLSCSESVYSMFSHVSSLHSSLSFLTFISIASSFLFRNIFI